MADDDRFLEECLRIIGVETAAQVRANLLWLGEELLRWNRKVNLTSISNPQEVIVKHLVDSLSVLPLLGPEERLLDVGSGGGFPGLPLAIVDPGREIVTVDAVGKKIDFQRHVVRRIKLDHCQPLHRRIEDIPRWSDFGSGFDVVISRAFASLADFAAHAFPCLKQGGRMIAMKGPEGEYELSAHKKGWQEYGLEFVDMYRLNLPVSMGERQLLIFQRV
ncbi:MAG: 16S rRNA (guanine(527)-N(7))-methyltransferase RsmG [Syntrophaceae bacterium]|nr:16S rRNA (guanine(527)-N(7))-methyltransferase RsmG [Syntrophaceae bacterium]